MKVIATAKGYNGRVIEPGESFEVPDGMTGSWFKPAEAPKPEPKGKGKTAEPDPGESEI